MNCVHVKIWIVKDVWSNEQKDGRTQEGKDDLIKLTLQWLTKEKKDEGTTLRIN